MSNYVTKHKLSKLVQIDQNGYSFSDGTSISMAVYKPNNYTLRDQDGNKIPLDEYHQNAIYSKHDCTLALKCRVASKKIQLKGPVTIIQILKTIDEFFSTPISEEEYANLHPEYTNNWNHTMYPTFDHFKTAISTYGKSRGDHVYFEGLYERDGELHLNWGS